MTKWIAALGLSAALAVATPYARNTAAAQPVVTGGLVNVTLVDILNNNNIAVLNNVGIGVAANVAAQICGLQVPVQVGVIAAQVARTGQATVCTVKGQDAVVRQLQISRQRQ